MREIKILIWDKSKLLINLDKNMRRWQYAIVAIWMCCLLIISTKEISIAKNSPQFQSDPRQWTELPGDRKTDKLRSIDLDFTYATTNNFVKTKLYPCARCFLRADVAKAVQIAHQQLQQQGYGGLRLFDCYRPQPIQQKMWNIKPDERYVANPTKGSDHNRGIAVDLTILDRNGEPLDMGTPFDEFSLKAHHTYLELSPKILKNRSLLKKTMASVGFHHIDTEWWHYAWNGKKPTVGNWVWDCT
jgi:zinc D-Ala-D-Ala dipeptidase